MIIARQGHRIRRTEEQDRERKVQTLCFVYAVDRESRRLSSGVEQPPCKR